MLDSFTKNFSRMALSFEFVFSLAVQGLWLKPKE